MPELAMLGPPGQGVDGDIMTGRPGASWTTSPGTNWPPLRLAVVRQERGSVVVAARRQQRDAAAPTRKRLEGQRPDARRRSHPHPPLFSRGSTASAPSIVPQLPEDTE